MCFFDQYKFVCNDWKWGNFRQHCQQEYRTGETCGMKMVYNTQHRPEKCTLCEKIERKKRRFEKHKADYERWAADRKVNRTASMEVAVEEMNSLRAEITQLMSEKDVRNRNIGNSRRNN